MSERVVLYLPRHTDLHEMAILAACHGFAAIEVEKVFFQHPTRHLKLILVYFSKETLRQGAGNRDTGQKRYERYM